MSLKPEEGYSETSKANVLQHPVHAENLNFYSYIYNFYYQLNMPYFFAP